MCNREINSLTGVVHLETRNNPVAESNGGYRYRRGSVFSAATGCIVTPGRCHANGVITILERKQAFRDGRVRNDVSRDLENLRVRRRTAQVLRGHLVDVDVYHVDQQVVTGPPDRSVVGHSHVGETGARYGQSQ